MNEESKNLSVWIVVMLTRFVGVYFIWNWLFPVLFRCPTITLGQAIALVSLCRLAFMPYQSSPKEPVRKNPFEKDKV